MKGGGGGGGVQEPSLIRVKYLLIYIFLFILTTFNNFSRNFNEDISRLVFGFVGFVGSVTTSGSVAGFGVG